MDAFLVLHAARGYGIDRKLLQRVFAVCEPFPLAPEFLASLDFSGDPSTPEHNAYLVARWIANCKADGMSDTQTLDHLCLRGGVIWKRPWWYRFWQWLRSL